MIYYKDSKVFEFKLPVLDFILYNPFQTSPFALALIFIFRPCSYSIKNDSLVFL